MTDAPIREPAVAGLFYPHQAALLDAEVKQLLTDAVRAPQPAKALIVPHAGYRYSGAVAASAYANLPAQSRAAISRVVLLGPAHRVPLRGLATPGVDAFASPLGTMALDTGSLTALEALPQVTRLPQAHQGEHSLEVQLPFLQTLFPHAQLLPLVVGDADAEAVAEVLDQLWGGPETLIVISSDLSHFHPYREAEAIDAATTATIEQLQPTLDGEQACGCRAINGLLLTAKRRGLQITTVARCNSGDRGGPAEKVVGYGAYALH